MDVYFDDRVLPIVQKAEKYCSADEHCRSSVRAKLFGWGALRTDVDVIIEYLCENDYINEERYALVYCNSKMRSQKWGRIKMAYQLRSKQIPKEIIESTLKQIDETAYNEILDGLAESKWELLADESDERKKRIKFFNFLASKGFENDEIQAVYDKLTNASK